MKNKGKVLFIMIYAAVLLTMGAVTITLYDNAKASMTKQVDAIQHIYQEEFQVFTFDLAKKIDPSYEAITFSDALDADTREDVQQDFASTSTQVESFFNNDSDFFYVAENLEDASSITNIPANAEIDKDASAFYVHIRFDEKGNCTIDGDFLDDFFSSIEFNRILPSLPSYLYSDIQIQLPKNMDVQFMLSPAVTSYEGVSGYVNSWQNYNAFSGVSFCIAVLLLCIFFLFYPIRIVSEVAPFQTIKNWNFEINLVILSSLVSLGFVMSLLCSGYTINGQFHAILNEYGIQNEDVILYIFNFIIWLSTYVFLSLAIFEIKYILLYGPFRFIKEHSLFGSICRFIKKQWNSIFQIDLHSDMTRHLLKLIMINFFVMVLIGLFNFYLMWIAALCYAVWLLLYLDRHMKHIQKDYQKLLTAMRGIVSEDFVRETDYGIFTSGIEELEKLNADFAVAVQEKVKSEKMKTELISNVSHDLKTPLTCIKNYIVVLADDTLSEEKRHEYLDKVQKYADRLKNLIDDLLEISKVDSGNIQLERTRLNIVDLVEQVYLQSEELWKEKQLTIIRRYAKKKMELFLDSNKTYRIFENLLSNISKYAMPNSRAYINIEQVGETVMIDISNISEEPMNFTSEEIMERFVRGDKSRSKQGSGLGLAIARSFTEAQNGTFDLSIDCDLFKVVIAFPMQEAEDNE